MKFCETLPYYRRGSPGKSRFERKNRFGRGGVFFSAGFVLLFLTIVPIIKYILELSFSQENINSIKYGQSVASNLCVYKQSTSNAQSQFDCNTCYIGWFVSHAHSRAHFVFWFFHVLELNYHPTLIQEAFLKTHTQKTKVKIQEV